MGLAAIKNSGTDNLNDERRRFRRNFLYRQEHGRGLNNYCKIYRLPVDDEEFERLCTPVACPFLFEFEQVFIFRKYIQHSILNDIMGGKYAPPMAEVMADVFRVKRKRVWTWVAEAEAGKCHEH